MTPDPPDRTEEFVETDDSWAPDPGSAAADRPAAAPDRRTRWLRVAAVATGLGAIAFLLVDDRVGWLDYQPGGTAFFNYVRPAVYLLTVVGAVVASKWELAGATIGAFAAGAIGAIAVNQLIGRHAVVVIALLAVPAALWLAADAVDRRRRRIALAVVVAALATTAGAGVGEAVYERAYGPQHPQSDRAALVW